MLRRELALGFRSPVTWLGAALGALLVGHGFVLALDLYSAASRSALDHALMLRELDPLAGLVRPMLGGVQLAIGVIGPIVASRLLAVEKERRTFGAFALAAGSTDRLVAVKLLVASLMLVGFLAVPSVLFGVIVLLGGHLDAIEVAIALLGHGLHAVFVATLAVMAAAWTRTSAQATALALVASLFTWMIDAGDGFAALAWLGPLESLSVTRVLAPFESGLVALGPLAWFVSASSGFAAAAVLGARFGIASRARIVGALSLGLGLLVLTSAFSRSHRAYDWSEQRRESLPPAAVVAVRALPGPIAVEVWMDRDDSRRRQIERDVLAKLRLARPDLRVETPLDEDSAARAAPQRDTSYGRIVVRVGENARETRSTSRKEIVTVLFEAAGAELPDWTQPTYAGYPLVVEGARRSWVGWFAYLVVPGLLVAVAWLVSRRRSR